MAVVLIAVAPFWIASLSMWLFLRKTDFVRHSYVIAIGSIVYACNWVTFFHTGDLIGIYPYAVAPLVLLFSYRIFNSRNGQFWNVLGLAISLIIGTFVYPVIGVIYLLPIILSCLVYSLLCNKNSRLTTAIKGCFLHLIALGLYVALLFPFTIYEFVGVFQSGVGGFASTNGFNVLQNYLAYIDPQIFAHYLPFASSPFFLLTSPTLDNPGSYLAAIVAVVGFVSVISNDLRKKILGISFAIPILLLVSLLLLVVARSDVVNLIYQKIPILVPINGFGPYSLIVASLLAILFTIGLDSAVSLLKLFPGSGSQSSTAVRKAITMSAIALVLLASLTPVISLNFVVFNMSSLGNPPQTGPMSESGTLVIQNLTNFFNTLRTKDGPFRVLWLPQSIQLNQQLQVYDEASNLQFGSIASRPDLMMQFTNLLGYSNSANFSRTLAELGYSYIVVLQNHTSGAIYIDQSGVDRYLEGGSNNFISLLNNQTGIKLISSTSQYNLYKTSILAQINDSIFWASPAGARSTQKLTLSQSSSTVDLISWKPTYSPINFELYTKSVSDFWLVFSENYDSQWQANIKFSNGSSYPLSHSRIDGWANGFYIPATKGATIEIVYSGEVFLEEAYIIWVLMLLLLVGIVSHRIYHERAGRSLSEGQHYFFNKRRSITANSN